MPTMLCQFCPVLPNMASNINMFQGIILKVWNSRIVTTIVNSDLKFAVGFQRINSTLDTWQINQSSMTSTVKAD